VSEIEPLYSGVFTECPDEWDIIPFPDAVDFREGPGILAKDFRDSGVPLLRLRNIERPFVDLAGCNFLDPQAVDSKWSHFRVLPGDLLVSTSGTLGRVSVVTDEAAGSVPYTGIIRMRPARADVDAGFMRYFLTSPLFQLQAEASAAGSVLRHFGPSHLREMSFPVPPPDEQRTIAAALGALDGKIEQNRRTSQVLDELARALFRAWFVDFDPVKAKAGGRSAFPSMPQSVFDTLSDTFVSSELGLVPEGWDVKPLADCVTLTMGQSPPSEFYNEIGDGLPFHQGVTDFGFRHPTHRVYCAVPGRLAETDDVLLSVRAPVGRINVADRSLVLGRGLAGLRHLHGRQSFLLHQLRHVFAEEDAMGEGTIYKAVTKQFLSQLLLLAPPTELQVAYEQAVRPLDQAVSANELESRRIDAMRDFLLPNLMSGNVLVTAGND